MEKTLAISFRDYGNISAEFDIPNACPHCGKEMSPVTHNTISAYKSRQLSSTVGVFLQCTSSGCEKYYTLEYEVHYEQRTNVYTPVNLISYKYSPPIDINLPANIEKVSPQFVEIYTEATQAEQLKLGQIAGVGYRKSAEFLIKDYAINKNPTDEDAIKSKMLMQVITKYLDDFPKIQNLAKAIAWIGNDETHYERRHDDKDIKDLKKFIKAAAQFIAADYDADEALDFTTKE